MDNFNYSEIGRRLKALRKRKGLNQQELAELLGKSLRTVQKLFAKVASRFDADITVEKDGNAVSGKSIMALMTLEAVCGTVLKVTASGPQAAEALDELEQLVLRKFDIPDEQ